MEARAGKRSSETAKGSVKKPTITLEVVVLDRRKTTGGEDAPHQHILELVDAKTGKPYYYNQLTGESTWDEPSTAQSSSTGEATDRAVQDELPDEWVQLVDSAGRPFEYNRATTESRWITTKKAKQNPAAFESLLRETSERPGELYIIQNSTSDQAYVYDRKTGESKYLDDIPPNAVLASVRSDDDDSHDVATDLDNSVIDYEQETESEESEDDHQQTKGEQIEDLSDLLEGLLLVRAIHEDESLFDTWPSLSHFIDVFVSPHTNWSTLMIIHKAVMSELGELHKFKNALATNNLHTNKASWIKWLGTVLTEWETKPTSLHRQYADELSGFLAEIDPKSSRCPFRLKRSADEDPRPTYSALDTRTRLAIFSCLCKWGLLKRSYFVDESMSSSFCTSARAWNLGQDNSNRTYFWFPTLTVHSLFRSNGNGLKRLCDDEESMSRVIDNLFSTDPPFKLKNWLKFIQSRVLTSKEVELSMDQNEVQEEEENNARRSSLIGNGMYASQNNYPPPPSAFSHYIDPFGSFGMLPSVVMDSHSTSAAGQYGGGGLYSSLIGAANNGAAVEAHHHGGMDSTAIMRADKSSGPHGGGMYSRLMGQNVNYGFPFQANPYVVMDQVRLVRPVPITSTMDHMKTNQSTFAHSPYVSHNSNNRPTGTTTVMANGAMDMPSALDNNGHNSGALAALLSAAQQRWVHLEENQGSVHQAAVHAVLGRSATEDGSEQQKDQAMTVDEEDTFPAAQRESESSSSAVELPIQTGVTPLKLPNWLKDTQSGSKTNTTTTSKSKADANVTSGDSSRLFKQIPPSSSSEHVDHFKDGSQMLPPPVRHLLPFSELTDTTTSSASTNENIGSASSQHSASQVRTSPKIAVRSPPMSFFPSGIHPGIFSSSSSSSASSPFKAVPDMTSQMNQSPAGARYKSSIVYDDNSSWSGSSKGAAGAPTMGSNSSPNQFHENIKKPIVSPEGKEGSKVLIDLVEVEPMQRKKKKVILTQEEDVDDDDSD